jgi:hypothetical protein
MNWYENEIYSQPLYGHGNKDDVPGIYIPYFYLHGKAEELNGYDICNGNIETFQRCLHEGAFLCRLHIGDIIYDAICFSKFDGFDRMQGLVCLLDDDEHIEHAVKDYLKFKRTPRIFPDEEDYLRKLGKFELIYVKQY